MSSCYSIITGNVGIQSGKENSYFGGTPKLPQDTVLPLCRLCNVGQTFFFQIMFPERHEWFGHSIAVFSCTSCADENRLIPRMPNGRLLGAILSQKFFDKYETNFKFIVFKTCEAVLRTKYGEKIKFKNIKLHESTCDHASNSRVGGKPEWYLSDESPGKYESSTEMIFLFQLAQDTQFEILKTAPRQTEVSFFDEPEVSPNNYYELFIANELYFFGVNDKLNPYVYVVTQT